MGSDENQRPPLALYSLPALFRLWGRPWKFYLLKTFFFMTSTVIYKGALRTEATHLASSTTLLTDAPVDNQGKGETFSPTDLVASALASCMLTIMGIKADALGIDITETKVTVLKQMAAGPRRIAALNIDLYLPRSFEDKTKRLLERAALNCPVAKSLAPKLKQDVRFHWPD